jgi:hypothetical protein
MDDPTISSAARPSLIEQFTADLNRQAAAQGIPVDHDQLLITLRSDGHSRHSAGVAVRVANQWTVGFGLEKEIKRRPDMTFVIGASWKRK